ncbi:lytic transglycosylase domain-containing protein [Kiritimatiellaeota bacterium B1221]|nr:lytic transglycosylase domain-containing protein [Kiritimatiellaeota bacterium B1221]
MKKQLSLLLFSCLYLQGITAQDLPYTIDWNAVEKGVQQVQRGVDQLAASEKVQAWARQSMGKIQQALNQSDWNQLQDWLPYIDQVETYLSAYPEAKPYVDWLNQRRDYFDFAKSHTPQLTPRPIPHPAVPVPAVPTPPPAKAIDPPVSYHEWVRKMSQRPAPKGAEALVPQIKPLFQKHGVPEEMIWLAEVESSFNPKAQSPVGARGLFQFMPGTARYMGLSTSPQDERIHPQKSADAAARYLSKLYGRFGDWPLTLAAYNAGEGRVSKLLRNSSRKDFNGIQSQLPSETRMYVPKVLATIKVREGVPPDRIPGLVK